MEIQDSKMVRGMRILAQVEVVLGVICYVLGVVYYLSHDMGLLVQLSQWLRSLLA